MNDIMQFFEAMIIITLGVIAVLFWLFVIGGLTIEIYDTFTGKDKKRHPEAYEEDDF